MDKTGLPHPTLFGNTLFKKLEYAYNCTEVHSCTFFECSTVVYKTRQDKAVQYSTVKYSTVKYSAVYVNSAMECSTMKYSSVYITNVMY